MAKNDSLCKNLKYRNMKRQIFKKKRRQFRRSLQELFTRKVIMGNSIETRTIFLVKIFSRN